MRISKYGWALLLMMICLGFSGCALLQLPFNLLNQIFKVVQSLPKPPPWVFF